MQVTESKYFEIINRFEEVPFEQTQAWLKFKSGTSNGILFFVDNEQTPNIGCWGRIYNKPLIGKILDIIGESRRDHVSPKVVTSFFKSIIDGNQFDMITYNSNGQYQCDFDIAMRRSGFSRPLGSRVCPLTIMVDVQADRNPDRNWKRNLKKATEEGLTFKVIEHPTQTDAVKMSQMFEELKEMKSLGYSLDASKLMCLIQDPHYFLCEVSKDNKVLSSRIVYVHNGRASDVFAANTFESRKYSATHYICEEIFNYLKNKGVTLFDFSRIPPSNNETDSVYLFKASSGGYPVQYNGEWIWARKKMLPLLFSMYNFYYKKSYHY